MSQQSPLGSSVFKALGIQDQSRKSEEAELEISQELNEAEENEKNLQDSRDSPLLTPSTIENNIKLISSPESPLIYDQQDDDEEVKYSDHESDSDDGEPTSYDVSDQLPRN